MNEVLRWIMKPVDWFRRKVQQQEVLFGVRVSRVLNISAGALILAIIAASGGDRGVALIVWTVAGAVLGFLLNLLGRSKREA